MDLTRTKKQVKKMIFKKDQTIKSGILKIMEDLNAEVGRKMRKVALW